MRCVENIYEKHLVMDGDIVSRGPEFIFLVALIPISFFTVIINTPSYVPGYAMISIAVTLLFLLSFSRRPNHDTLDSLRPLPWQIILFLIAVMISTVLSIDIAKTVRGLFLIVTLVVLVYYLYIRNLSQNTALLFLKIMLGTVLLFQIINNIILIAKVPIPSFIQSGNWPYLFSSPAIINSNYSGMMISFSIPALTSLIYTSRGKIKYVYSLIGLLLMLALMVTLSRGAILMLMVYVLVLTCLYFRKSLMFFLGFIILAALSYPIILQNLPESVKAPLGLKTGFSGRDLIWAKGVEYVKMKPLFGSGYRTLPNVEVLPDVWINFHNMYLAMAVELGLIATALFLVIAIVYLFITTRKVLLMQDRQKQFVAFSCIAFLISVMVHHFFEQVLFFFGNDYYANVYFVIYLAILQMLLSSEKDLMYEKY